MTDPTADPRPTRVTVGSLVSKAWKIAPPMLRTFSIRVWAVASVAAAAGFCVMCGGVVVMSLTAPATLQADDRPDLARSG